MPLWFRGMHVVGTPRYLTMGYNMLLKPLLSKEVTVRNTSNVLGRRSIQDNESKTQSYSWIYRDQLKSLNVVAGNLFLLFLNCSAWPCLVLMPFH